MTSLTIFRNFLLLFLRIPIYYKHFWRRKFDTLYEKIDSDSYNLLYKRYTFDFQIFRSIQRDITNDDLSHKSSSKVG